MMVNGIRAGKEKSSEFQAYGYTYRSPASRYGSEALTVKVVTYNGKDIVFGIISRGFEERKEAEIASATSIKVYSDWFFGQLREGNIGFIDNNSDVLRSEWDVLHCMLRSKANDYAIRKQVEVDVLSTIILADTFSCNLQVFDLIGVGIYRISEYGAKLILPPYSRRLLTRSNRVTQYSHSFPHRTFGNESVSSANPSQYVDKPRWFSFSLKDKDQYADKEGGEAIYLICTGEIIEKCLPEELSRLFRPKAFTGLLPAKVRLERLISYGGTGSSKHDVSTGSAILIRYSP